MTGPVQFVARAIAAGFVPDGTRLRVTLSFMPGAATGRPMLETWPSLAASLRPSAQLVFRGMDGGALQTPIDPIHPAFPKPSTRDGKIIALWQRIVAPAITDRDAWKDLLAFLCPGCATAAPGPLLQSPTHATALALTFGQAGTVLSALAGGPLQSRSAGRQIRFASLNDVLNDASGDMAWPSPETIADAALGGDTTLGPLRDRILEQHANAIQAGPASPGPEKRDYLQEAGQRLGTVLASPVLQRLFGFAVDVDIPIGALDDPIPFGGFLQIGLALGDVPHRFTLARYRPPGLGAPYFGPVTWAEARQAGEGSRSGVELLEASGHYHLCSVDADLGMESISVLKGMQKSGQARADQVTTLRSGGLRLLDIEAAQREAARRDRQQAARTAPQPPVEDADALQTGERLDLGLDTEAGVQWRCAMHRVIYYAEPGDKTGWVEQELKRLVGSPGDQRRLELEAGTAMRIVVTTTLEDGTQAPTSPEEVAAWGGEPMGTGLLDKPGKLGASPIALSIDLSLPSVQHHGRWALAMPMRFGWPYRAGLRRVHVGGVALTLAEAAEAYAQPGASLPSKASGRRLLRHERVGPPSLGMTIAEHRRPPGPVPAQAPGHAVIRTALGKHAEFGTPHRTVRMLLPPSVGLDFASLHDVFSAAHGGPGPPPGARARLRPEGDEAKNQAVAVLDVERPGLPAYPDPAASTMVLRLRRPDDPAGWLDDPVIIPIAGTGGYPDILPIRIEIVRGASRHLRATGQAWLGPGERLIRDTVEAIAYRGLPVATVELALRPGEDVQLDAWCVPTIDQLVDWFDVVESACVLATQAGSGRDVAQRCARGLAALLGPGAGTVAAPAPACTGAGGLPVPGRAGLLPLAGLLHQMMMREPVLAVAAIQTLRATHATDRPATVPELIVDAATRLAVARRLLQQPPSAESGQAGAATPAPPHTLLDFLATRTAADWTMASNEDGAAGAVFGGAFEVELATTAALELRARSAGATGRPLDDPHRGRTPKQRLEGTWPLHAEADGFEDLFGFAVEPGGTVVLPGHTEIALRLDGLPAPADAAPGMHRYRLEAVQAAALGSSGIYGRALRTTIGGAFADPGARKLTVTPVAIARHAGLIRSGGPNAVVHPGNAKDDKVDAWQELAGAPREIWLPATKRPAPPVVHDVAPLPAPDRVYYKRPVNGWHTVGQSRRMRIRVRLKRPWFSSGEGEQLGLVLWPPALFARGTAVDDAGTAIEPTLALVDADLGPGGQFVSRWAADAIKGGAGPARLIPPAAITGVKDRWTQVPRAYMPLPGDGEPDGAATMAEGAFLAVALLTVAPRFDPVDELWYVEFDLDAEAAAAPLLRLGLVRYQPEAREDEQASARSHAVRLRVSTPVSAWVPPLPPRRVEATWQVRDGILAIIVAVHTKPTGNVGGDGAVPGLRVEVLRRPADLQGGRLLALDRTGVACRWESWASRSGVAQPVNGGEASVCQFEVVADADHWVFVEEVDRMLAADDAPGAFGETGPRLLALLYLDPAGHYAPTGQPSL